MFILTTLWYGWNLDLNKTNLNLLSYLRGTMFYRGGQPKRSSNYVESYHLNGLGLLGYYLSWSGKL